MSFIEIAAAVAALEITWLVVRYAIHRIKYTNQ